MEFEAKVIKNYLKNVFFITGTAYAGKSTMAAMLADRYHMYLCGENYQLDKFLSLATVEHQPNLCYFSQMKDWQEYISRTPEQYEAWIYGGGYEMAQYEIMELISCSKDQRVVVDTNIPIPILKEIADYDQVAVMVSPQSMSVERFFDRPDPEKQFILEQIKKAPDPEWALENFRNCVARVNSKEHYEEYVKSGFFTLVRDNCEEDTREQTLNALAKHFRLNE